MGDLGEKNDWTRKSGRGSINNRPIALAVTVGEEIGKVAAKTATVSFPLIYINTARNLDGAHSRLLRLVKVV